MSNQHNRQQMYRKVDPYLEQKILSASPEKLVSIAYDTAIAAVSRRDRLQANRVISQLIVALDFEQGEIAQNFFTIYRYLNRRIQKGHFEEARRVLVELRQSWNTAMKIS